MPGTILDTRDSLVNKTNKVPHSDRAYIIVDNSRDDR